MSLLDWRNAGWIRLHKSTPEEIRDHFGIVDQGLADAASLSISEDARHYLAYNAALKLCAILLLAEGYRPEKGQGSHQRTIDAVRLILGDERQDDIDYLHLCRSKRHTSAYDIVGTIARENVERLVAFTKRFRSEVLTWLRQHHPDLARLAPK